MSKTVKQLDQKTALFKFVKMVAPGTEFREGLDNILKANTGAIIVLGDDEDVMSLTAGGFSIDSEYSPAKLYELAKMDGAIVLSKDARRIVSANTQLEPDANVGSDETGIRHRTAEKFAKQTSRLVISISQRRNIITLYYKNEKYVLKESSRVLIKANQAIQTLENYKKTLDKAMGDLEAMEFEDSATLYDVCKVLQRIEMMMKIVQEIESYILELGIEGRLISMQLQELTTDIKEDSENIIRDYAKKEVAEEPKMARKEIKKLDSEELWDLVNISKILGYENIAGILDQSVEPYGYRILAKIPRLPNSVLEKLIEAFGSFQSLIEADTDQLEEVDGIGEKRAKIIADKLMRLQERAMQNRTI
ncbi:MAG: DNA integrity scanning diadenylate cyclase DisA [Tissierellales bacterium]|nr:DNA integrity scanning diadenylate cyclase DisA [Tissierellales bacterium]